MSQAEVLVSSWLSLMTIARRQRFQFLRSSNCDVCDVGWICEQKQRSATDAAQTWQTKVGLGRSY